MRAVALAAALTLVLALPADASPEDLATEISSEVMSPWCPGVTVHDCPSRESMELRAQIEEWAKAGWSRERIMSELRAEYGDAIAAAPPRRGAGLVAWLMPLVAVLAGGILAWSLVRKWTRRRDEDAPAAGLVPSPTERARLEAELAALRSEQ